MVTLACQSLHDISKSAQAGVDGLGLLQRHSIAITAATPQSLAACKVDEVQAAEGEGFTITGTRADDLNNAVATTRACVHVGARRHAALLDLVQHALN